MATRETDHTFAKTPNSHPHAPKREVWVWLGRNHELLFPSAVQEVLYEAHQLAQTLGTASVVLTPSAPSTKESAWLARWGVSTVYTLFAHQNLHQPAIALPAAFNNLRGGLFAHFAALPSAAKPAALLLLADAFGRASAPAFAQALGGVCVSNAVLVQGGAGDTGLKAVRPLWGGKLEAQVETLGSQPLVASLLANAVGEGEPPYAANTQPLPEVIPFQTLFALAPTKSVQAKNSSATPTLAKTQHAKGLAKTALASLTSLAPLAPGVASPWTPPDPDTMALTDAERVVAFGRGAFNNAGIALVQRLAKALGAVIACTRPAADEGWMPFERQVGLTGVVISPQLYVAIGISGAPYHMVGLRNVRTLVAINQDAQAPIFAAAHFGLVGNLYEVLPPLLEAFEAKA